MKSVYKYRSYFKAVLFSTVAALAINTAISFDDLGRRFKNNQAKTEEVAHADSLLKLPKKVGAISTSFFRMFLIHNW